jgi:lipopolysaccharide transport system permease protein
MVRRARELMGEQGMKRDDAGWDLVIEPPKGWLRFELGELWRYRDLVSLFVARDFSAQYKQTVLGPAWHLIQPLLTTLLFTLTFGRIAKLPTDGVPPMLFYLAGITCWSYFADCLDRTAGTFVTNAGLFGKVYFPRLAVPVSVVISNMIKFAIQLGLFLVLLVGYSFAGATPHPNAAILLLPVLLVMMAALGLGVGIVVSSLTTKYRDLQVLFRFAVQLAMYLTPVIYPLSIFPERVRRFAVLNPMTPLIEAFRYAFLGRGSLDVGELSLAAAITAAILLAGMMLFHRVEQTFMDTV